MCPAAAPQRSRPRGFTLIELLVAMTLLGLLMTLSLPSFTGWLRNTQARTVAESLQNGLRIAQTEALRRSIQVVFYRTDAAITAANISGANGPNFPFSANGANWVVLTTPTFGSTSVDYVQGGSLGSGGSAMLLTQDPSPLCFDPNGRIATNAPASLPANTSCKAPPTGGGPFAFVVTPPAPGDRPLQVQVASTGGKVRMCDPKRLLANAPDGC